MPKILADRYAKNNKKRVWGCPFDSVPNGIISNSQFILTNNKNKVKKNLII